MQIKKYFRRLVFLHLSLAVVLRAVCLRTRDTAFYVLCTFGVCTKCGIDGPSVFLPCVSFQRTPASVGAIHERDSERRKVRTVIAIKTKAHTVVGKGEKSLLNDSESELQLGREKEGKQKKRQDSIRDGLKKKKRKHAG